MKHFDTTCYEILNGEKLGVNITKASPWSVGSGVFFSYSTNKANRQPARKPTDFPATEPTDGGMASLPGANEPPGMISQPGEDKKEGSP
jgi:hypothetical protein